MDEFAGTSEAATVGIQPKVQRDWGMVWGELKVLVKLSAPTIIQGAAQQGMLFTDQIFLGHLGTDSLAAAALGTTYSNIFWFFLLGASTALDTLGAQAYGANNHMALVTVSFTAVVVLSGLTAVSSVGLCFGSQVARTVFGQGPEVSRLVGEYCWGLMPGMWPLMWFYILTKYLQAQNMMTAASVITVVAFACNIGFNAGLIKLLGFVGAPLATTLSRTLQFLLLAFVVYRHECKRSNSQSAAAGLQDPGPGGGGLVAGDLALDTKAHLELQPLAGPQILFDSAQDTANWTLRRQPSWFHVPSFRDMSGHLSKASSQMGLTDLVTGGGGEGHSLGSTCKYMVAQSKAAMRPEVMAHFLKLALPGGLMLAFEAGSFDFTTAMAGHLGSPVYTAAHAAMFGFIYLAYVTFPFAISTAATIRVGNLLGAHEPLLARMSSNICVVSSVIFMGFVAVFIFSFKDVVGYVFSSDPEVVAAVAVIAPMAALFQISDGILGAAQGVLRGCGRQTILMVNTIVGFWLAGILLGYLLAFKAGLGLLGLWIGLATGDWVTALLHGGTLLLVNWEKEAQRAVASMEKLMQPSQGKQVEDAEEGDKNSDEVERLLPNLASSGLNTVPEASSNVKKSERDPAAYVVASELAKVAELEVVVVKGEKPLAMVNR